MIDLKTNSLCLNGKLENIKLFAVWWQGVDGLHATLDEAKADADKNGYDYNMLKPMPVCIGEHGHYEIFLR